MVEYGRIVEGFCTFWVSLVVFPMATCNQTNHDDTTLVRWDVPQRGLLQGSYTRWMIPVDPPDRCKWSALPGWNFSQPFRLGLAPWDAAKVPRHQRLHPKRAAWWWPVPGPAVTTTRAVTPCWPFKIGQWGHTKQNLDKRRLGQFDVRTMLTSQGAQGSNQQPVNSVSVTGCFNWWVNVRFTTEENSRLQTRWSSTADQHTDFVPRTTKQCSKNIRGTTRNWLALVGRAWLTPLLCVISGSHPKSRRIAWKWKIHYLYL